MSNSATVDRRIALPLLLALAACGGEREPATPAVPPPLPGVPDGSREWAWRDVLERPLPGEPGPAADVLALQPASARMDALAALCDARDPRAPSTLMAALRDPQDAVAAEAARLLGEHGHERAIPRLLAGLGPWPIDYDLPPAVRCAEAAALARLGNPGGVELILVVLAEGTPRAVPEAQLPFERSGRVVYLQELALPGLVALAGTDFGYLPGAPVPRRLAALEAAHAWWRGQRAALWAAAPAGDPGLLARARLIAAWLSAYQLRQIDGARFVLPRLGPGVLPVLEQAVRAPDAYARVHSLEVLERLAEMVDGKARVRIASLAAGPLLQDTPAVAVQAAATCGAARVADQLIVALGLRTEPALQVAVLDALGQTGLPAARDALRELASSPRAAQLAPDARAALQAALLACDPQADPGPFLQCLASPDAELAYAALQRLIALTGDDHGLDPSAPPEARADALAAAREALRSR